MMSSKTRRMFRGLRRGTGGEFGLTDFPELDPLSDALLIPLVADGDGLLRPAQQGFEEQLVTSSADDVANFAIRHRSSYRPGVDAEDFRGFGQGKPDGHRVRFDRGG